MAEVVSEAEHVWSHKARIALFLSAMRYTLSLYGAEVRSALAGARGHRERLEAIIGAGFTPVNFHRETIAAWLNFYVLAQSSDEAQRLLTIYRRRLQSNLVHDLRPLVGARAPDVAQRIAGLIDGLYLHHALRSDRITGPRAAQQVLSALDSELAAAGGAAQE